MKTVAKIIDLFGGLTGLQSKPIRLESSGFMPLCIEAIGTGPRGLPMISVAHYGEQNGDAMRDPDMVFEVDPSDDPKTGWRSGNWHLVSFRNDYVGVDQEAAFTGEDGRCMIRPRLVRELKAFARIWNRNLNEQGFFAAAQAKVKAVAASN